MDDKNACPICGKTVSDENYVTCVICKAKMHRDCIDEEVLTDATGDYLCPYDAAIAALDWFDSIITCYSHSLTENQRRELLDRLRTYIELLEHTS